MFGSARDTLKTLKKAGAAQLVIEISSSPDDHDFARNTPHVEVTASAVNEETGELVDSAVKDMSAQTPREDRILELRVETEVGTLARVFSRRRPESLRVKVTATPIFPWNQYYEVCEREVLVQAGKVRTVGLPILRKERPET